MTLSNTRELIEELSQNFIDFSYEANSQRAFADARDGLKPGQRACLWEMFDKGYTSGKPHVKSAKISGGVIANWWPHGDTAIYDTFARMSQPWINNMPEVAWHGNNGSVQISGEPAHQRYTEARLSKMAEEGLLHNMKTHNVPMKMNFSEDMEWPEVFPALIPRLMINGCQGIGSTIANVWLPHSLDDLYPIIVEYARYGTITAKIAPSFPSGGVIINKDELDKIYTTGKGKCVVRAKAEIEDNHILITEIPYQVYVEPLVEQIKKLVADGTIEGIDDIYNKSDKKRLLIDIECDGNPGSVLRKLYKETDLQKSYSANQFALVGKTPRLLNLQQYLDLYIHHNYECIIRQYQYELNKAVDRREIVEGLLIALDDIDAVITVIRASESAKDAVKNLWEKFPLNERQAKAIVDMKLGRLAHLERIELHDELGELKKKIDYCQMVIESEDAQRNLFLADLADFVKKYPDPRRTAVTQVTEKAMAKEIVNVEPEKCVVVFTESGMIKRVPSTSFKVQKRNGAGVKTQDGIVKATIRTNTIDSLLVFSSKGKMYRIIVDDIPVGTNASKGVSIQTLVDMDNDEQATLIYSMYYETDAQYVFFATKNGTVKKTALEEYLKTKKKNGIAAINLRENDALAAVTLMKDEQLLLITKKGMGIRIKSTDIAPSSRATIGIKGINLADGDEVIAALPIRDTNDQVAVFTKNGLGKRMKLTEFMTQTRGGKGVICYKPSGSTGDVVAATLVNDEDTLLVIGSPKAICISAKDISVLGRPSTGVQIIKGTINAVSKI